MKKIKGFCFVFLLTNLIFFEAFAQRRVIFDMPNKALAIGREIEIFEDKTASLTFEEVSKRPDIGAYFRRSLQINPNFGVTSSVIWARITLQNKTSQNLYLEIAEATIDSIAFYKIDATKKVSFLKSGTYVPIRQRDVETNFYLLDLNLAPQETSTYYIRFQSSLPLLFPLRVAPLKVYFEDNHPKDIMQGIYIGIMLVMAIFNFFIFFTVRTKVYLYYVIYVLSFASFFAYNKGFINEFIWSNAVWFNRFGPISISIGISFGLLFANSFLNVEKYLPISTKIAKILIALVFIIVSSYWLGLGRTSIILLNAVAFVIVVYVLVIATYIWMKGSEEALFFLFAWSIMLISAMIFIMQLSNILPSDSFSRNALQVGSALEVVLLSFALAHRINKDRKEKEKYQAEVIHQLQANDQMRNRIARDLHDDIGSTLSSIGILSQVVETQIDKTDSSLKKLVGRISESSQKVQRSLSDIVWTTKQTEESLDSVIVKMKEFTAEMLEPKNIDYTFSVSDISCIQFSPLKQYNIYLIFKEAVNNSVKYAQASNIEIAIFFTEEYFTIIVKDNGIGFDELNIKQGNGLNNMQERAKVMNGKIQILTKPQKGTLIELKVPLNSK
ncbi:7TM diverse intracellular signaling domain-containing protein [Arcicella sp. DC2W]|uniref:7TM diverse intracellular signaling domain-containing protein n=1 Tax=Arcicella gelida TaxID=2984195 RepID=A0ABU5S680_9BACT|nr:7TM diverse intracellular signaling domain-containing protein [Arcicella sp. DC2W]MEA5403992.1 7TM diverse intracellular signaling domain-containing protein [Arcicella sp. DC2W]